MARPSLARSTTYDSGSSFLATHTLASGFDASGTDGVLVVVIHQRNPISEVTSVTVDTNSMTLEASNVNTNVSGVQIYTYVVNDASVDVVANTPSFKLCAATVMYWENVDATDPIFQTWTPAAGFGTTGTSSLTANSADNTILSGINKKEDASLTVSGLTSISNFSPSNSNLGQAGAGYADATGSSQTLGFTWTGSDNWSLIHGELTATSSGDDHTILTNDIAISLTEDNATISENHTITTQDISLSTTTDNATISQNHVIVSQDVAITSQLDTTTVNQNHTIVPSDIAITSSIDTTTVTQTHTISPNDIAISTTIDATTLTQNHIISTSDITVASTTDNTSISQNHVIQIDDITISSLIDNATIDLALQITPQDISIATTLDEDTINQNHLIVGNDIALGSAIDSTLIEIATTVIVPNNINITTQTDNTVLEQIHTILTNDITISSRLDLGIINIIGLEYYNKTNLTIVKTVTSSTARQQAVLVRVNKQQNNKVLVTKSSDNIRIVKQNTVLQ